MTQSTTFRTSTKQDNLADHVVEFLSRVSRTLRNLADSADHAAKTVRKAARLWDFSGTFVREPKASGRRAIPHGASPERFRGDRAPPFNDSVLVRFCARRASKPPQSKPVQGL